MSKLRFVTFLAILAAGTMLTTFGCNGVNFTDANTNSSTSDNSDTDANSNTSTDTNTDTSDDSSSNDDAADTAQNPDTFSFTGNIVAPPSAKRRPRHETAGSDAPVYIVVAQSADTLKSYRATTNVDGSFKLDLPDSETGNLFSVTILNEDGRAEGPLVFGTDGDKGKTGIDLASGVTLGTIELPDAPGAGGIMPGAEFKASDMVADDVTARLDSNGAPVGVASLGKGTDALGASSNNSRMVLDKDGDGLPDFVDADNDGNGIIDDFDNNSSDARPNDGVRLNFFMNLKIAVDRMNIYYSGTDEEREEALKTDTVVTFEVSTEPSAPKQVKSVRVLDTPAPTYLPDMTLLHSGGGGADLLWSGTDYAFSPTGNSIQAFITPNELLNAGDSFTVEVTFEDDSTTQYTQMINYVFKNIPRLMSFGTPMTLTTFTGQQPIPFDGTEDFTVVFQPPVDESGAFIDGLDWRFEFFFLDSGNAQIQNIDGTSTWPTPIPGWETNNHAYTVNGSSLTLGAGHSYLLTLPKELFVDTLQLSGGGTQAVTNFQIDIAAQKTGNAAIKLNYHKN